MKRILWWGRFDPEYSRNRIIRRAFDQLGCESSNFHPRFSALADWEARLRKLPKPDLVWVPCFRQRDVLSARRWCNRHRVPLVFDPLISSYDKQVFERKKFSETDAAAKRLLQHEIEVFAASDRVIADTSEHAKFYHEVLRVPQERLFVIPVAAEESLFFPATAPRQPNSPLDVLFFGSFLSLQGPEVIVEAARCYRGPAVRWCLLGDGPLRAACEEAARGFDNVTFENWLPYEQLPERIRRADILLGIFGDSAKAARVIPNKAFQAIACGKPLVTRSSAAYPPALQSSSPAGIIFVPPNDPQALANAVAQLASKPETLPALGEAARRSYVENFSEEVVVQSLARVLNSLIQP